jgi:hypothetical protein
MSRTLHISLRVLILSGIALLTSCTGQEPDQEQAPVSEPPQSSVARVEIRGSDGDYQLYRNGEAYFIKGAGLEYGSIESLHEHGGNSLRNWTTLPDDEETTLALLDRAHELGMTVSLCLPVVAPRWGFDYSDPVQVQQQKEAMKSEVMKYKDHPALLTWIIGNELDHSTDDFQVYNAVNDMALMIKDIDPNHPTTTSLTGLDGRVLNEVRSRAPDLDFISFQVYGQLAVLSDFLKEQQFNGPFMITEWGAVGYWEMGETDWGAPYEMDSTEKAANYRKMYEEILDAEREQMIGDYVFLWGQKQERTPTWFGMFTELGEKTEAVDVMHNLWRGDWPANRSPQVSKMTLNGLEDRDEVRLVYGQTYRALIEATDIDGDQLSYRWEIKPESDSEQKGGAFEESIESMENIIQDPTLKEIEFIAKKTPGAYRLFVYISDGNNHVAHANIPFYVEPAPN